MEGVERYWRERRSVEGWLADVDFDMFVAADGAQLDVGVSGDLFEIGTFLGASAILLGYFRRDGEALHVCDLFEMPPDTLVNAAEQARWYGDLTRGRFEANFARFHATPPIIHQQPSESLDVAALGKHHRLVHVDGCHVHAVVRSDVATTRGLTGPGGIVVFDDFRRDGLPGVGAAVWEAVATEGLVPLVATTAKLYCSWDGDAAVAEAFQRRVLASGHDVDPQPIFERDVLCVQPRPPRMSGLRPYLPPIVLELRRKRRDRLA